MIAATRIDRVDFQVRVLLLMEVPFAESVLLCKFRSPAVLGSAFPAPGSP